MTPILEQSIHHTPCPTLRGTTATCLRSYGFFIVLTLPPQSPHLTHRTIQSTPPLARPRSLLLWLGTGGLRLNGSRTALLPQGTSGPRGGEEGSGGLSLPLTSPFGGGRLCLLTYFPREMPSARCLLAARGRRGGRSPSVSPASGRWPAPSSRPDTARRARTLTPTVRPCPVATPGRSRRARRS